MALEATFRGLTARLHQLNDAVNALHITLDDKPAYDEAAVADDLSAKTLDFLGLLHEARRAAVKARQALRHPPDMDQARRSLVQCQERFHDIDQKFAMNLVSYETLKELARVGGRGAEWSAWAASTKRGIEECREPLDAANQALAACWQELAERLGMMSISVRQKIVGQQIAVPKAKVGDLETEGVT